MSELRCCYGIQWKNRDMTDLPVLGFCGACCDPTTHAIPLGNGYRWYFPALMRFNAPDDLSPFGRGGIHPYAYCSADPINYTDPSGHVPIEPAVQDIIDKITESAPIGANIAAKEPKAFNASGDISIPIGARSPEHVLIAMYGFVAGKTNLMPEEAVWRPKGELHLGHATILAHYSNTVPEKLGVEGIQAAHAGDRDESLHFSRIWGSVHGLLGYSDDAPYLPGYLLGKTAVKDETDRTLANAYKYYVMGHPDDYHMGKVVAPGMPSSRVVLARGGYPLEDIVGWWRTNSQRYEPNPSFRNRFNVEVPAYFLHPSDRWIGGWDSPRP